MLLGYNNYIISTLSKKKGELRTESYWICQKREGAFPSKLTKLIAERKKHQKLLEQEKSKSTSQIDSNKILEYGARQTAQYFFV
jgi:DNA polymerase elongation subunit (family B)